LRTKAAQAEGVFLALVQRYPRAADLRGATDADLDLILYPLGLHWRIRLLKRLIAQIAMRNGHLPRSRERLMELPGVGPYAAAASLSLHRGDAFPVIDANVVRVVSRLADRRYNGETRRDPWIQSKVHELTPAVGSRTFNLAILDLAASVCRPTEPVCPRCPVLRWCSFGSKRV
jgi:A/G-specific adenine glycosylase